MTSADTGMVLDSGIVVLRRQTQVTRAGAVGQAGAPSTGLWHRPGDTNHRHQSQR